MFDENKNEEYGHMGRHMMGMKCFCSKEFMLAKLDKKAAFLKVELDFIEKMKAMVEKEDFEARK